jgi:DDE superfamily endonuclease
MKKKPSIPDAILAIDFGGLSTRVFCQSSQAGSKASSFVMESQVGPVSQDIANCFTQPNLASASPENIAWVAIGNECRAVGYLAAAQFNAHIGLAGLKYSSALYKALAALWVVSRKLDLGNQFSAAIAVFLPPGEFNDSKQFFELLSQYSASFETPTGKLSVTLDKTQALQEGGGIALIHNSNLGSAFKQRVTAFVMVGFRNASVIVSARGAVGKGKTSDLGMVRLVDLVQERTSNYDASRLALSIAQAGVSYNRPYFYRIARNREDAAKDREVDQLIEAVKLSRFDYARMLSHWINEVLPLDAANAVGVTYHKLHHFLTAAPWSFNEVNQRRLDVMNQCNQTKISRGFSLIIDDSGHRKSGNFTEGVGRQYIGQIGKTDNGLVVVTSHLFRTTENSMGSNSRS